MIERVYVLTEVIVGEGSVVLGAFSTLSSAKDSAEQRFLAESAPEALGVEYRTLRWRKIPDEDSDRWMALNREPQENYNRITDYWLINDMKVE